MEVVGSGVIWDARSAPVNERSASATSAIRLSDGTVLATCRLGTDREGPDGHTGVFASTDRGETWELRYLSLPEREWDGWPGETRGWYIAELTPGVLTASVLWTDRTDPADPWVHPVTQGLLGMRVYQLISTDGGRTLARTPADRPVAAPGGVVDRPGHRARRRRPRPAVRALEGDGSIRKRVGRRRGCGCRPTAARPGRTTSSWPTIPTTPSTTGTSGSRRIPTTAVSSTCSGPATSAAALRHRRPHLVGIAGRSRLDRAGRDRAAGPALPAHLARGRSAAGRLLAPWRPAGDPRRAERGLRADLGSGQRDRRLGERRGRRTGRRPAALAG